MIGIDVLVITSWVVQQLSETPSAKQIDNAASLGLESKAVNAHHAVCYKALVDVTTGSYYKWPDIVATYFMVALEVEAADS